MAKVECFHCGTQWDLADAHTNRCPTCGWVTEIYVRREHAERVARIYNDQEPPLAEPSGITPLIGMSGYAVAFPDQARLAEVAEQLLEG